MVGTLKIKGMTCQSCAPKIEENLMGISGIIFAKVDFKTKTGIIYMGKNVVSVPNDSIEKAVTGPGYKLEAIKWKHK